MGAKSVMPTTSFPLLFTYSMSLLAWAISFPPQPTRLNANIHTAIAAAIHFFISIPTFFNLALYRVKALKYYHISIGLSMAKIPLFSSEEKLTILFFISPLDKLL